MYKYCKRFIDVILSIILIVILFPLCIIEYIILKIDLTKSGLKDVSVLWRHYRIGYHKQLFYIYKFRTLDPNESISREKRLDNLRIWIRRSGMDELPQLINILKGDMSFVGPRPLKAKDSTLPSSAWNDERYVVKPGVFGLAQSQGRRNITHEIKMQLDLQYIKEMSFKTDFKLFFLSLWITISQLCYYINETIKNKKRK